MTDNDNDTTGSANLAAAGEYLERAKAAMMPLELETLSPAARADLFLRIADLHVRMAGQERRRFGVGNAMPARQGQRLTPTVPEQQ